MPSASKLEKKEKYDKKLCSYLDEYTKAFIVGADNVGSKQFMNIRAALRELDSVILMGKNTMIRRCVRLYCERTGNDAWAAVIPQLVGNVGIIFTKGELNDIREKIGEFKVGAAARVGLVAPNDVFIPAGGTGLDPSQTSFFQALNIATKINKGTIEIVAQVHVIKTGEKVGGSEATLLAKLGIKPFQYGLVVLQVYDNGSIFDPAVLDITDEDLAKSVTAAIANVTAAALALHHPTILSVPHLLVEGYKNVLAVAIATDNPFKQAEAVFEYLKDPSKFVAAAPTGGAAAQESAPAAAEAAAPEPEPEEEEEEEMDFDLFD